MELRRRQPAGARLVHHLHLPPGEGADRRGRQGLAQELFPEAAAELHLVGQPQGPHGAERLRGRLPGPGQHRRLRPQRAAADRRLPGAGRRHRLDGPVLPEHARDRRRAGDDRSGLRGHGAQVRRALPVDRLGDGSHGRRHAGCGTRRTASSTTCCGCPTASAQRLKVRSMVGLLPLCAATVFDGRLLDEVPGARWSCSSGSSTLARSRAPDSRPTDAGVAGSPDVASHPATRPSSAACWRKMLDENEFLSPFGIRSLSRYHADHPFVLPRRRPGVPVGYLPAESDTGMFGGNSNWRGPIWMPVNALIIRALLSTTPTTATTSRSNARPAPGSQMTLYRWPRRSRAGWRASSCATRTGRRPVYGGTQKFQDDPHWRDLHPVLRVLPRRQRGRPRRQPPDRLDRRRRPPAAPVRAGSTRQTMLEARAAAACSASGRQTSSVAVGEPAEQLRTDMADAALPVAVPDQHPRLADRAVARSWAGRRRWTTSPTPSSTALAAHGFRLGLVPERLADRAGRPQRSRAATRSGAASSRRRCRTHRRRHRRLRFAITGYTVHQRPRRRRGPRPAARAAAAARPEADARLRPQPHGAGPSVGRRASRVLRPRHASSDLRDAAAATTRRVDDRQASRVLAYGRDPYFAGWPDTLQLDYGNPATAGGDDRRAGRIAGQCDGVRCDMAMLVLPDVFERTWGIAARALLAGGDRGACASSIPDFVFMAEVYWDLEWTLQQQGFDYTYDKRLYDRLREGHARPVREHFRAGLDYQDKLARFLENHDEPAPPRRSRASSTRPRPSSRSCRLACASSTRASAKAAQRIPLHVGRAPDEATDPGLAGFYDRLLACLDQPVFARGSGNCLTRGPPGTATARMTISSASRGQARTTSGASSWSTTPATPASVAWHCRGLILARCSGVSRTR